VVDFVLALICAWMVVSATRELDGSARISQPDAFVVMAFPSRCWVFRRNAQPVLRLVYVSFVKHIVMFRDLGMTEYMTLNLAVGFPL